MDPSPLLNTEILDIRLEFWKLLNKLKETVVMEMDPEEEDLGGTVINIQVPRGSGNRRAAGGAVGGSIPM